MKYAIATSSCTGAIHMGMHALGIGPGDEVILADTNWIATAAPIVHLGATPVCVDILQDSWCLDPDQVEAAITPNTKAIVAVHLYGNLCDMDALIKIGERHGIPVIEDAAEAIGSVYHSKRAGSIGHFGTFSFHGTKTVTTGEGGMFVTNDPDLFEKVLILANHGRSIGESKQFWPNTIGYKFKMSNIEAAIGCAQLERIEELISIKKNIFTRYRDEIVARLGSLYSMNPRQKECINGYWMPTIVGHSVESFRLDSLVSLFKQANIDARVTFWPLSSTPIMEKSRFHSGQISSYFNLQSINLPSPFNLSCAQQNRVLDVLEAHNCV